jgi:integrase
VFAGIRRTKGSAPDKKRPVLFADPAAMLGHVPDTAAGKRDRALLLLGFAGGFRRSELVGLDVGKGQTADGTGWIKIIRDGIVVTVASPTSRVRRGKRRFSAGYALPSN